MTTQHSNGATSTTQSSRGNLLRNKKGIGSVFGTIFFLLVVIAVFSSLMIILDQNGNLERTAMQMRQADSERAAEKVTVLREYFPATGTFRCTFSNTGTIPIQLVRVWIQDQTNMLPPFPPFSPLISLQPGQSTDPISFTDPYLENGSPNDFRVWVVTARGNQFSYNPSAEGPPEPPSGTYWITATADPYSSITPRGVVSVAEGGSQTFNYSASPGYTVTSVLVDGAPILPLTGTYTFSNVQESHTISVSTTVRTFTITASADSTSSITPSGDVPVIQGGYQTFVYWASPGYAITSVTVDGSPADLSGRYTFSNIQENHNIAVTSAPLGSFTITASAGLGGSIRPSGFVTVRSGEAQTFTITPNTGYSVANVAIDGSSVGPRTSYTFENVVTNHIISASFTPNTYMITASSDARSTISPSGTIPVTHGSTQTFTYTANPGYTVTSVLVDGAPVATSGSYTFSNIQTSHNITVSTTIKTYTITASAGSGGTINPNGFVTVSHGSSQTFTITPITGYSILDVVVNGVSVGPRSSYTFENVMANHIISATFRSWSAAVSQGIGSLMMDFDDFYYYRVYYSGGRYYYDLASRASGYSVNQAGLTGLLFRVKVTNADPQNRTITLNSQSVFWTTFPWSPQQVRGSAWYLVNVNPATGLIQPSTFQSYELPYNANGTGVYLYFASENPVTTSSSFKPCVSGFDGTAPVNLAVIGTIAGNPYGQNLPFVSIVIRSGAASVTATPSSANVGTLVTLSGSNFVPFSTVTIMYDGDPISTNPPTITVSSGGTFSNVQFRIPASTAGAHTITAAGGGNIAQTTFTVTPAITITPTSGPNSTIVSVNGSGFAASRTLTATFGGEPITLSGTTMTNGSGSFSGATFIIAAKAGARTLIIRDADSNSASATFTVTDASISLSPTSGRIGTIVTVTGSNFLQSSPVTIQLGTGTVANVTSTPTGTINTTFPVPPIESGSYTVTASDGVNLGARAFTVSPPFITLTPNNGRIGSTVTVTGGNFTPGSQVTMTFGTLPLPTLTADSAGNLPTSTFTVPTTTSGTYIVSAADSVNTAQTQFTVNPPTISLSPNSGPVSTSVTITGVNFVPNTAVTVTLDGVTIAAPTSTSSGGIGPITHVIQPSPAGAHIFAADDGTNIAVSTFTVTPSLAMSPTSGLIGSTVTLSGTGFAADSAITVTFAGTAMTTNPATVQTNSAGSFSSVTFTVPTSSSGGKTVLVTDANGNAASQTFTVTTPSITINPTSGNQGITVTISGSNFMPNSQITVTFAGTAVNTNPSSITTDGTGSFTATFTIPSTTNGSKTIQATDASFNSAQATFTVNPPTISLNPTSGPRGTSVTVTGSGFSLNSAITITFAGSTVTTTTTSATGTFSASFTVPAGSGSGANTVRATDANGNPASATFTITVPTASLSPTTGAVGTTVTVTGSGFAPNSVITVRFAGTAVTTTPAIVTTTSTGTIPTGVTFTVPPSPAGNRAVNVTDAYGNTDPTIQFRVTPRITIQPTTVVRNTKNLNITITGTGFAPSSQITAIFDGKAATISGTTVTDANGSFSNAWIIVDVPNQVGNYIVRITDSAGNWAEATLSAT